MRKESATNVKNNFGAVMDTALREPVIIQRSGRNTVVMLAYEAYEQLLSAADPDVIEALKVLATKDFIGTEASEKLLMSLINAEH